MSTNQLNNFSYGNFTDQILQYANQTFSVLHQRFLKQIWGNNTTTNKLHKNQAYTNWQNATYECYIPTRDSVNNNLEYLRVAVQVLPEVSDRNKRADAYKLQQHLKEPLGIVESELLVLVGYKQDKPGIVKGFKHQNKPGYFTAVMVSRERSPELIWKRVIERIGNFIDKRLGGLMRSLGFEDWVWKWLLKNKDCSNMYAILERFSFSIRQSVFTFLELYHHLYGSMRKVMKEIGVQNVMKHYSVRELRSEIEMLVSVLKLKVQEELSRDRGLLYLEALRNG